MTGIAMVVTMPAPGYGGTYKISQAANGSWIVSGPALPSNLFVKGATAALKTALPDDKKDALQSVSPNPNGNGSVAVFAPPGMPGAVATGNSNANVTSNLIIVMPIKVDGGSRHWARTGKWARTWFIPATVDKYQIIEVVADTQDKNRFFGFINNLSGNNAYVAAQETMSKYGSGKLVIAMFDRSSQTVKTWMWSNNTLISQTQPSKQLNQVEPAPAGYSSGNGFVLVNSNNTLPKNSNNLPEPTNMSASIKTGSANSSANAYQIAVNMISNWLNKNN